MKKFPIIDFDFKAEDQTKNLSHLVATAVSLREEGIAWKVMEEAFKKSKYAEYVSWSRLYRTASRAHQSTVPAPIMPEKVKTPAPEVKLADHFPQLTADRYSLLRQLIIKDLQSDDSVIIADIATRLNLK